MDLLARSLPSIAAVVLACVVAGCGKDEIRLVPVSGTLTVEGKPLGGAGVSFQAAAEKGNSTAHIPSATTDAAGKYELTTTLRKGAPPGWYKVAIFPPSPQAKPGELPEIKDYPYAKKYADPKTTDLLIEVKDGIAPGGYDIQLKR